MTALGHYDDFLQWARTSIVCSDFVNVCITVYGWQDLLSSCAVNVLCHQTQ
jgi:hypothetical protein